MGGIKQREYLVRPSDCHILYTGDMIDTVLPGCYAGGMLVGAAPSDNERNDP